MQNVLFVTSSLMSGASTSRKVASELVQAMQAETPALRVTERDLTPASMPHLSAELLGAFGKPADQRSASEAGSVAFADRLIEEVEAADTIVIAAPMYNFSVPSTLKAWIDHIARAGRTFRYTANGPEGLLKGKKVHIVVSRGGVYTGESPAKGLDFQEPYLRGVLGFVGLDDVSFIHVEGQAIGPEAAAKGLASARAQIGTHAPFAVAA